MKQVYSFYFCLALTSLSLHASLKNMVNNKIAHAIENKLAENPDVWWKKRLDPFVGYPSIPPAIENPNYANELYWFFPREKLGSNLDEKLALPTLGSFEFSIRRVATMALNLITTFFALNYRHFKVLKENSAVLHFSNIILYDFLIIVASQGIAFNLGNFLEYCHRKLIQKYPFFRTKKGDAVFKTIAYILHLALPVATFYAHYLLPIQKRGRA